MKSAKIFQAAITYILLISIGGFGGYYLGVEGYDVKLKTDFTPVEIIQKENPTDKPANFTRFWQVWDLLNEKHIKRPLDPQKLMEGAISGMIDAVGDPYSVYLNPEQNSQALNSLNGKYEGIGAQLGYNENDQLIIVAPLDGSPAVAAGIKAGDRIVNIAGVTTAGISIEEAVNKIRGDAGTSILLTIGRDGVKDPFDLNIKRDTITLKSVTWEDKGDGVAYIRLSRFGSETNSQWDDAVNEITAQMPNLKGIVLDVRNNPGGYLESAVYISSEFIDSGTVVKEDFSTGESNSFDVDHKGKFTDPKVKVVVLINEGSASASEIVSGALKEKRGAELVGMRSFGKGTVQKPEDFTDGASFHVTIAKWLTPDGNWIDKHNAEYEDSVYNVTDAKGNKTVGGLKPDFEVKLTDEDIANQNDAQLEKAKEVALSDTNETLLENIKTKVLENVSQ